MEMSKVYNIIDEDKNTHMIRENDTYKLDIKFENGSFPESNIVYYTNKTAEVAKQLLLDLVDETEKSNKLQTVVTNLIVQGRLTTDELFEMLNKISPTDVTKISK